MVEIHQTWRYEEDSGFIQTVQTGVETKVRGGRRVTYVKGLVAFFGPRIDALPNPHVKWNTTRALLGTTGVIADDPQHHVRDMHPAPHAMPHSDDWRIWTSYRQRSYQIGLPEPDCWPAIPTDDVLDLLRQIRDQLGLWAPGQGPDTEEARDDA